MPSSFLKRHRTICNTLREILDVAVASHATTDEVMKISELVNEATGYAQSMSNKLVEYKREKEGR